MKRKLLFVILLVLLIAGGFAAWKYFERTDDFVKQKPDASISAPALIAAFDQDTASARRQYVDRVLAVSGTVTKIDGAAIELGDESSMSVVVVALDERHLDDVKGLAVGNTVTIQGQCTGYEKGSGDDLLADLGTTVQIKAAGVKSNN